MGMVDILNRHLSPAQIQQRNWIEKNKSRRMTRRMKEILPLICNDLSNTTIARLLGVSFKTVEHHRSKLNKFAGVHSAIGLYKWALVNGYTPMPKKEDK
jgi:DNA-binding NarL/FixJ family response regulator